MTCTLLLAVSRRAEPHSPWITFAYNSDLYRIRPDGTDLTQLTAGYHDEGSHSWSPDGRWIAFSSYRESGSQIYKMRANGTDIQRLTASASGLNSSPNWSPDGEWLVFDSNRINGWHVYTMRADGSEEQQRTSGFNPVWSPNGEVLAFISPQAVGSRLRTINWQSGDFERITPFSVSFADWSPDGEWLTFGSSLDTNVLNIYIIRADGTALQRLTFAPDMNYYFPVWSPDGDWIAYVAQNVDTQGTLMTRLYKMRIDGSAIQQLSDISTNVWQPRWTPIIDLPLRSGLFFIVGFAMLGTGVSIQPLVRYFVGRKNFGAI